jgi:PleD family two-component response regulator
MTRNSILLIDPYKNIADVYRILLEQEKFLLETAENLDEALQRLSMRHYSVIITEYFLPFDNMDRMIQRVKLDSPETYIIMVTDVIVDKTEYEKFFTVGLDDLILKPFSPEKILSHIRKGLKQRELTLEKQEVERQSIFDPITRQVEKFIFNPAYFMKSLRQEIKRAKRHQHPLSLLLIQILNKEKIGNRFENFCIELIQTVRTYLREEDVLSRDQETFGILLPETDQMGSQALAWRLSNLIQNHPTFKSDETLRTITQNLSFQTFTYPNNYIISKSLKTMVEEIDKEYPHH